MLMKLIGCEVFTREICHCVSKTSHIIDIEFTEKGSHDKSDYLRQLIQNKIDACQKSEKKYDAVLLCYGLCGNSTLNLVARDIPLIVPRAHDCCTLFLGSKTKFREYFGDRPSTRFSSAGYIERGNSYVKEASDTIKFMGLDRSYEEYVQLYGEENAKYIWQTLHPQNHQNNNKNDIEDVPVIFIEVPENSHLGYAEKCKAEAQANGKKYVQLPGDIRLIKNLVFGEWNDNDFLIVKPQQRIVGVYDWEEIIRAEDIT